MIVIDICLTDIPKDAITEGKNGKKYLKLVLNERKSEGKFGETHTLQLSQTKEARLAGTKPTYVGSGKAYKFEKKVSAAPSATFDKRLEDTMKGYDDLPF